MQGDERFAGEAKGDRARAEGEFEASASAEPGPKHGGALGTRGMVGQMHGTKLGDDTADEIPSVSTGYERAGITRERETDLSHVARDGKRRAALRRERKWPPTKPDVEREQRRGDGGADAERGTHREPEPNVRS